MLSVHQLLNPITESLSTNPYHPSQSKKLSPPPLFDLSNLVSSEPSSPLRDSNLRNTPTFVPNPQAPPSVSNILPSPSSTASPLMKSASLRISTVSKRTPPISVSLSSSISKPKERIFKGPWRASETNLLSALVREHGACNWSKIASFIPGRTGKQARERYKNHLDPALKKGAAWTADEDNILLSTMHAVGNKWAFISKKLPGRSDNDVKNRYNSILRSASKVSQVSHINSLPKISKKKKSTPKSPPTFVPLNLRWYEETPSTPPPTMFNIYDKFKSSHCRSS